MISDCVIFLCLNFYPKMIEMISMKENSKPKVAEYLPRQWISKYNLIVV